MHDLIHDLALSIAKNEFRNSSLGRQDREYIYKRIKHVSFSREEGMVGEEVPKSFLKNNSSVRGVMPTIWCMCFDGKGGARVGKLVKTCISKLKHLRVLDLMDTKDLKQLPNSIGTLKHLRYLNLSGCKKLKRLPDSITKLYNLQTLSLMGCEELEELPKDIGDLINLKQLFITTKQRCLSVATANGIKSLRSLQLLSFVDCPNLEYVFELEEDGDNDDHEPRQQLPSLQILGTKDCKSMMFLFRPSITSAPRKRSCFISVESLGISGCPNLDLASTYNDEFSLTRLKSLMFEICHKCTSTLEYLAILDCPKLTLLPKWLRNLTSLRQLRISDCPELLCLPEGIQYLTALTELKIEGCPVLSRRCKKGKGEDWPKIAHIPKLDVESEDEDDQPEIAAASSSFFPS